MRENPHPIAEPRRASRRSRPAKAARLSLTSMIDVIFLLLIYFVITANFVEDEGVLVAMIPGGQPPPDVLPQQPVEIYLTSLGAAGVAIETDGRRLEDFNALSKHLIAIQNDPAKRRSGYLGADNPIVILPDRRVRWQHAVNAYNSGLRADYTNIRFDSPENEG